LKIGRFLFVEQAGFFGARHPGNHHRPRTKEFGAYLVKVGLSRPVTGKIHFASGMPQTGLTLHLEARPTAPASGQLFACIRRMPMYPSSCSLGGNHNPWHKA